MLVETLLVVAAAPIVTVRDGLNPPTTTFQSKTFEERLEEAGDDVDELWSLYLWCDAGGRTREGRTVLRKIVDLDSGHRGANEALGYFEYHGRWFKTERALEAFKAEEEEREALEKGLVRFKGEWVSRNDVPYLERGLVPGPTGGWVTKEERRKLDEGWVRQDLQWIEPGDVEKVDQGLWKCGDEWLPLEDANRFHAQLDHWWRIPTRHFHLFSTLERNHALEAGEVLDRTFDDLVHAFGAPPPTTPIVVILRGREQYNEFAGGRNRPGVDGAGLSSVHYAFLADNGFDTESQTFLGAGVALWDASSDEGKRYGRLAARHAAGQAFAQAIDPSPKAIARAEKKPERGMDLKAFYEEKALPDWLRYGAAAYVERYFVDNLVGAGGDPFWAKAWSVENLRNKGGLLPLSSFFGRGIDVSDEDYSNRWINQAGLVMAFIVKGGVDSISEAHRDLMTAHQEGKRLDKQVEKLEKTLIEHEAELSAFMNVP